jgi:RNA polymerase sigma-70 factor (ECF subfamily)
LPSAIPSPARLGLPWKSELDRLTTACAKALSNVAIPAKLRGMKAVPGTLQEGGAVFATTHWSVVLLAAQNESPEAAQMALGKICQAYWPPLYTFVRRRGHPPANAQDLVQAFFVNLLKHNSLSRVERDRGRLRTFLLSSLQHFMANEYDRTQTQKRGGGEQIISLDEHFDEAEAAMVARGNDPTASYDRNWATTLLDRAWDQLQTAMKAEGKEGFINEVKPLIWGGAETPPNQELIAVKLNLHPSTLRTSLQRLRQRFREILRAEVGRTVSTAAEIDEELRYLCHVLTSEG